MNAPAELAIGHRFSPREAGLWMGAAAAIVFAHVAISLAFQSMTPLPEPDSAEEAMVVELAQLPFVSVAAAPADTITEEEVEAQTPDQPEMVEEEVTETVSEDTPEPETQEEAPLVEDEVIEEKIAEMVESEVVIPVSRPERVVEETPPEKPKKRAERKPERKVEPKKTEAVKKAETKREARAKSESAVESRAAKAPTVNPARWDRAVQAAIARSARRSRGTKGSVTIAFAVTSSGAITGARVASSSGNSGLDNTALSIVRSARVPPPPPELGASSRSFTIPMLFK